MYASWAAWSALTLAAAASAGCSSSISGRSSGQAAPTADAPPDGEVPDALAPAPLPFTFAASIQDGMLSASELAAGGPLGTPAFPFASAGYAVVADTTDCASLAPDGFAESPTLAAAMPPTEALYKICTRYVDASGTVTRGASAPFLVDTAPPVVTAAAAWSATGLNLAGRATGAKSWGWTQASGPRNASIAAPAETETAVTGLTAGAYVFLMTAQDEAGNQASARVPVTIRAPQAPTGLVTAAGVAGGPDVRATSDSRLFFGWTPGTEPLSGIAGHVLEIFASAACAGAPLATHRDPKGTSFAFSGSAGSTYSFRATARALHGLTTASACSGAIVVDTTAPPAATALTLAADASNGPAASVDDDLSFFLHWTQPPDGESGIRDFSVRIFTQGGCAGTPQETSGLTEARHAVTGLDLTTYSFRVVTFDRAGNATVSGCSGDLLIDATPPPAATNLVTAADAPGGPDVRTDDDLTIYLSWSQAPDSGSGVASWDVRLHTDTGCTGSSTLVTGLTQREHTVNASDFTTYSYRVITRDGAGHATVSACSGDLSVNTIANTPVVVLGATAALKKWEPLPSPARSAHDGGMKQPISVAAAAGNLFVMDRDANRLDKFNSVTGDFAGWTGAIAVPPSGGGACASATAPTDLFCLGGVSRWDNFPDSFPHPDGVAADATHVYTSDEWGHNIMKRTVAGVRVGWTGGVAEPPSSGGSACTDLVPGDATPTWCGGGFVENGAALGKFHSPRGLALDATFLYVADHGNHRIVRVNKVTGNAESWLGTVGGATPTGGAAGCTATPSGTATPGWCVGGTSQAGWSDGAFARPSGVAVTADGGTLYVAETGSNRIQKFLIDGTHAVAYVGWIGEVGGTAPSGGAAGCDLLTEGDVAPGWCTGGSVRSGSRLGAFDEPRGLAVGADGFLYVADRANHRIVKIAPSGAVVGWIGRVGASPTGGDAGCEDAPIGSLTPGWCTGGLARSGRADGAFDQPASVSVDGAALYVADSGNSRVQRFVAATGAFDGGLGANSTTANRWLAEAGTPAGGPGDGTFATPHHVAEDGNGNLYVSDRDNGRVVRLAKATGIVTGWIGAVRVTPTGGDTGCAAAAPGSPTPGWCLGGEALRAAGDGALHSPTGVAIHGTSLYVADAENRRLNKFQLATGAFVGWVGKVGTTPTGGAAGCDAAAPNTTTPGWCTGGTATYYAPGSPDHSAGFLAANGVAADSDHVYVAEDREPSRIQRFVAATGAYAGWIGNIRVVPTAGGTDCTTASVGSGTPIWCYGGEPQWGHGDNAFNSVRSLALHGGYLYVADFGNARVARVSAATGAFAGWAGDIDSSPTGGDPDCNGASSGTHTPGWCTGGVARGWSAPAVDQPSGIAVGGGHVYVALWERGRIYKLDAATGAIVGWRGKVRTPPTAGGSECTALAAGDVTPRWCSGGTAVMGFEPGAILRPLGLHLDGDGRLFIVESDNHRLSRWLEP